MSTATANPPIREFLEDSDHAVLHEVPWDDYVAMRDDDAYRHVRMDYFRGTLELMSPKYRHEKHASRLAQFILRFTEIMDVPCTESRSTTFRRKDEGAGKEADTSFYIANEPLIRDKDDIDLAIDPPPDLAIEVNIFNNSEGKLPIYASLRVPEVWRYDARSGVLGSAPPGRRDIPSDRTKRGFAAVDPQAGPRGSGSLQGDSPVAMGTIVARMGPQVDGVFRPLRNTSEERIIGVSSLFSRKVN